MLRVKLISIIHLGQQRLQYWSPLLLSMQDVPLMSAVQVPVYSMLRSKLAEHMVAVNRHLFLFVPLDVPDTHFDHVPEHASLPLMPPHTFLPWLR